MRKYLIPFFVILFSATLVTAQTVTTKVATTTVVSDDQINEATFFQLLSAIDSFNGQEITLSGKLGHFSREHFWCYTDNNEKMRLHVTIDDGRSVKKRAMACTEESFCNVSMTIELKLDSAHGAIDLGGVGYDVKFLD